MDDILPPLLPAEATRLAILQQLADHHLTQAAAADLLGVTTRQVKRLLAAYRTDGPASVVSKKRGQPSNHRLNADVEAQALALLRTRYPDFGPTFAHEKLTEIHGLTLSVETVRHLMVSAGLWRPKQASQPVVHQLRPRRACFGELVQIDGSPHAWFEDRAPVCTLLVFIDDATSHLLELHFAPAETTCAYFAAVRHYLECYGKPLAFYSDRNGIFRINQPGALSGDGQTQFGRAMSELGITLLCASTPQAKGRVERMNQTLQDRLVKELRLAKIDSIPAAHAYLPTFMTAFNQRFAVLPQSAINVHRPLTAEDDLARSLTLQTGRVLSKNLTLQYNNVVYQIQTSRPTYALRQAQVMVREDCSGGLRIEYKGAPLEYTVAQVQERQGVVVDSKAVAGATPLPVAAASQRPAANHPWRRYPVSRPPTPPTGLAPKGDISTLEEGDISTLD
jgi:hypothetical protein